MSSEKDVPSRLPSASTPSPQQNYLEEINHNILLELRAEDGQEVLTLQLQRQIQVLNLINQINTQICSTLDLDEVLHSACCLLGQALNCSRVIVMVTELKDEEVLVTRGEYSTGDAPSQLGLRVPIDSSPLLRSLVTQPGVLVISKLADLDLTEQTRKLTQALKIKSVLAIATRYQGQVNGVIGLHQCDREREWLPWEQDLLEGVGRQLAVAISQAKFYSETRRRMEQEAVLRLVTNQIRRTLDLNTILQTVVQEVRQLLKTDRVVIYRFIEDWQGTVVVEDVVEPWTSVLGEMGQDDCFSKDHAHLYENGRIRAIDNIFEAGLGDCHVDFLKNLQVQANLIVPILMGTKLWGLLIAHECRGFRVWQSQETELLQQLADQVAIAIQQAELYAQIQASATQFQTQAEQLQSTLEELRAAQIHLIQSEKLSSLGQMVAGIAHEINNANNFVHANLPFARSYTKFLSQAIAVYEAACPEKPERLVLLNEEQDLGYILQDFPKLLQSMQEGSERIREIVLTLRNFSRLDEANIKFVNLHEGLDSSLTILRYRIEDNVQIHKQYGSLPKVECDASQINQVFLNLLNNALDAVGEDAILTIRTWQNAFNRVIISIQDNGHGIPVDIQNRIFDPFFTTKDVGQGTGLGLAICQQVVEGHGGQIHCISQPGQGAEFQVELPLSRRYRT